jgi:hypothetical protein
MCRAQILLKRAMDWTNAQIAEALPRLVLQPRLVSLLRTAFNHLCDRALHSFLLGHMLVVRHWRSLQVRRGQAISGDFEEFCGTASVTLSCSTRPYFILAVLSPSCNYSRGMPSGWPALSCLFQLATAIGEDDFVELVSKRHIT